MSTLPHEHYLRFLLTQGAQRQEVSARCEDLALAPPDDLDWKRIVESVFELNLPKGVREYWRSGCQGAEPKGVGKVLRSIGLGSFSTKKALLDKAVLFASDTERSVLAQGLLIKGVTHQEAAGLITVKTSFEVNPDVLAFFHSHLFNTADMLQPDWRAYLHKLPSWLSAKFLDIFRYSVDEFKIAYGLPASTSYVQTLQELQLVAMRKFRDYAESRDPDADGQARAWASVVLSAGDRYEKFRPKDMGGFTKDLQMAFQFVETKFESIDNLSTSVDDLPFDAEVSGGEETEMDSDD